MWTLPSAAADILMPLPSVSTLPDISTPSTAIAMPSPMRSLIHASLPCMAISGISPTTCAIMVTPEPSMVYWPTWVFRRITSTTPRAASPSVPMRLDMRMNRAGGTTAADLLATAPEDRLVTLFKVYGEFRQARRLAAAIVKARNDGGVTTTGQLAAIAEPMLNPARAKKELAQIFQALRIEVNGEMEALEAFLAQAARELRPGGRLAIITYHSLEDRMVKNFMRSGRIDGEAEKDLFGRSEAPLKPLGKAIVPTAAEVDRNPRARSAKLRVAEKL